MKTISLALIALVAGALVTTTVRADHHQQRGGFDGGFDGGFGMPSPQQMMKRMAKHLDLSDTQRDSLRNIMEAAKPEVKALREKAQSNRQALRNLSVGDAEIQNIAISNGELATEGTLLFARIRGEFNAILTDEQRAKLDEMVAKRAEKRAKRKEQRQERG